MNDLTLKQQLFVDKFMINGNAAVSYQIIYGIKDILVASAAASRLLTNVKVADEIEQRKKAISKKYNLTVQTQIDELNLFIESCTQEGLDGTGKIKDRNNWMKAIAEKNRLAGLITTKNENKQINPIQIDFNLNDAEPGTTSN